MTSSAADPVGGAAAIKSAPTFLGSPLVDALTHVTAELAAELWVVKCRVALLEGHLRERDGIDLDTVRFDDDQAQANAAAAAEFAGRVFRAMQELAPASEPGRSPQPSHTPSPSPTQSPTPAGAS